MAENILIVDDDPAILTGVTHLLMQAGYTTRTAATGQQALDSLADTPYPALVILDIILPDLDGYTVCRRIRQLATYVPIMMLSVRDQLTDKVLGLELGADDYLTKPFAPAELVARVRALLRFAQQHMPPAPSGDTPCCYGSFQVWRSRHRVTVHGQEVDLTPTEWSLLEVFLDHPDRVLGRETLFQKVWGTDFLGDSRLVDMHVQRLRAKLEPDDTPVRAIQTVRGFGYRFVPPAQPAVAVEVDANRDPA